MNSLLLLAVTVAAFLTVAFLVLWFQTERNFCRFGEKLLQRRATKIQGPTQEQCPAVAAKQLKERPSQALTLLKSGQPCSELILGAYAPSLGLSRGEAFEIGLRLAGKMNMTETCGAVTGAWLILGKQYGLGCSQQGDAATEAALQRFTHDFVADQGTITCRKLLNGQPCPALLRQVAGETALPDGVCPKLVKEAAELLESMLN